MFLGTYTPRLDDKGRFVLPAKFRDEFSEGLVIVTGQEHCLYVFTDAEFKLEAARVMRGAATSKADRMLQRMYASGASEETPDKQGRLTIPPIQRAWARLDKDIAVIGAFNRLEIWDLETWNAFYEANAESFADLDEDNEGVDA